jgi:hypothetical protein
MQAYTESTRNPVTREIGLTGKLLVGGTVSTGLLLGGYTVAAMTLAGRMNGNALLLTSLGLFIVGSVVGLVLSAALGLVGREDGVSWSEAFRRLGLGTLYAIPACLVGAVLAGWIGMAVMGLYVGKIAPIALTTAAAVTGLGVMAATFKVTCDSGRNVLRRVAARVS